MLRRLTHHLDERPLTLVLVLPTDQDRAPLRTALSIATGHRGRLRALCLSRPGAALPPELRIALYGPSDQSDADLAIQHLVASSNRGAHVIVSPVAADEAELLLEARQLGELDPDVPLVVGWCRTGPLPRIDRLQPLVDAFKGPIVLLVDDNGPLASEVLGLLPAPRAPAHAAVQTIVRDLERTAFFVREDQARAAVADSTAKTLVVAALPPQRDLESAVPGRLALVLTPAEDRTKLVLELIEKVSQARQSRAASAEAPPPPPPAP